MSFAEIPLRSRSRTGSVSELVKSGGTVNGELGLSRDLHCFSGLDRSRGSLVRPSMTPQLMSSTACWFAEEEVWKRNCNRLYPGRILWQFSSSPLLLLRISTGSGVCEKTAHPPLSALRNHRQQRCMPWAIPTFPTPESLSSKSSVNIPSVSRNGFRSQPCCSRTRTLDREHPLTVPSHGICRGVSK